MTPKLTTADRIAALTAVINRQESVSSVCKRLNISRTLFYSWLKKYHAQGAVGVEVGKRHPVKSSTSIAVEDRIRQIIKTNPEYSSKKISLALGLTSQGKPVLGNHGVQNVLKRLGLSVKKDRLKYAKQSIKEEKISKPLINQTLTPDQKLEMLERNILDHEPVSKLTREYGISRTLFYRLKNRYEKAALQEKLAALKPRKPEMNRWWHQTPEQYEQSILSLITKHPEYSVKKLVPNLPHFGGVPVVGHHGVQNVLRRYNLSTYAQRLAYAQSQITPVTQAIGQTLAPAQEFFGISESLRHRLIRFAGVFALSTFLTIGVFGLGNYIVRSFTQVSGASSIGMVFAAIAFITGSFFFLYSFKYYLTLAIVLSYSQTEDASLQNGNGQKRKGLLAWILGLSNGNGNGSKHFGPAGLEPNLEHVVLDKHPYFSIHIPFYNEKNVVERAIAASTNFDYPGDYEVILCDDSTDETTQIIQNYQKKFLPAGQKPREIKGQGWVLTAVQVAPGVTLKHLHRISRSGFKGGALGLALKLSNPKTEFVSIFDADFVPYPDTLELFMKYFKVQNNMSEDYKKTSVAAVCGYQWHVLNKSENWITRGVRTEYAGSYVIERSGTEIYGGMKLIHGSVYAIRKDALEAVGWDTSITEDFELTLKLYNAGYKVVYTPYIQAPAECVSTLKRLIRQRMRWAEGHSHNIKKMFGSIMTNPKVSGIEKMEFLYLTPYYLQAFFFLIGTFCWLLSETLFPARLPFWTSLWGWSLVLTNLFALPLMNAVGLFLEESEERDYVGLASFVALSYIIVPFQAYAAVKGFIEKEEGTWFRTPKTGKITDVFTRGRFYRFISGILPGKDAAVEGNQFSINQKYLALSTAHNQFNAFNIKPKQIRWLSKIVLIILLTFTVTIYHFSYKVSDVYATAFTGPFSIDSIASGNINTSWQLRDNTYSSANSNTVNPVAKQSGYFQYIPGQSNGTPGTPSTAAPTGNGWIYDVNLGSGGSIADGNWTFTLCTTDSDTDNKGGGYPRFLAWRVALTGTAPNQTISSSTNFFDTDTGCSATNLWTGATNANRTCTLNPTGTTYSFTESEKYLYVEIWDNVNDPNDDTADSETFIAGNSACATDPNITTPTVTVPEFVAVLIFIAPFIPSLVLLFKNKKEHNYG